MSEGKKNQIENRWTIHSTLEAKKELQCKCKLNRNKELLRLKVYVNNIKHPTKKSQLIKILLLFLKPMNSLNL